MPDFKNIVAYVNMRVRETSFFFFFYYPINDNAKIKRNAKKKLKYSLYKNSKLQFFKYNSELYWHVSNQSLAEVCVCQMES